MDNFFDEEGEFQEFHELLARNNHVEKNLTKGTRLDDSQTLNYIVTGQVIGTLLLANGDEQALLALGPDTFFPFYADINFPMQKQLTFECLTDTQIWIYRRTIIQDLIELDPAFAKKVRISYVKIINFLMTDLADLRIKNGLERLCSFLDFYLTKYQPQAQIIPIQQTKLANLVGINNINLSRYLKKLRQQKAITIINGKIKVIDPQLVKKLGQDNDF